MTSLGVPHVAALLQGYVTGKAFMYHKKQIPQLLLETVEQIADAPVRDTVQLHHAGERYHLAAAAAAVQKKKVSEAAAAAPVA